MCLMRTQGMVANHLRFLLHAKEKLSNGICIIIYSSGLRSGRKFKGKSRISGRW